MRAGLNLFCICTLAGIVLFQIALCCGSVRSETVLPVSPFESFDDDPTIYNDCDYCHGLHNARRDVSAVLNDKEERYQRYIGDSSGAGSDRSVFENETSRKCPRSRARENR